MKFFEYVPAVQQADWIDRDAKGLALFSEAWLKRENPYTVNKIPIPEATFCQWHEQLCPICLSQSGQFLIALRRRLQVLGRQMTTLKAQIVERQAQCI